MGAAGPRHLADRWPVSIVKLGWEELPPTYLKSFHGARLLSRSSETFLFLFIRIADIHCAKSLRVYYLFLCSL